MTTARDDLAVNRQHLPFRTDGGIAARAAIGVVVLATDQTIEHEFRRLLALPGVAFYESRIWNDAAITSKNLKPIFDTGRAKSGGFGR